MKPTYSIQGESGRRSKLNWGKGTGGGRGEQGAEAWDLLSWEDEVRQEFQERIKQEARPNQI